MLTAREPHKSIPQIDYGISSPDLLFSFSGTLELAQFAAGRAPRLGHDVAGDAGGAVNVFAGEGVAPMK
jgi:hypothetical protein